MLLISCLQSSIYRIILPAGTINFSTWVQFEGGINITRQRMQSGVLERVYSVTTRGPRCCPQWMQPRSLLRHQLPSLQAVQCTRPLSMPRCVIQPNFCTWSPIHLVWILLLCGHYLWAGLFCSAALVYVGRDLFEGGKKLRKYGTILPPI